MLPALWIADKQLQQEIRCIFLGFADITRRQKPQETIHDLAGPHVPWTKIGNRGIYGSSNV